MSGRDAVAPDGAPARPKPADAAFAASVRFRAATPDDVAALVAVINAAYEKREWRIVERYRTDEDEIRSNLVDPAAQVVVAECDGQIAGTVTLTVDDARASFGLLAVAGAWQGRGLAGLMIAAMERRATAAGCTLMRIQCVADAGMPPFYRALGYKTTREEMGVRWDVARPFLLMELEKALA